MSNNTSADTLLYNELEKNILKIRQLFGNSSDFLDRQIEICGAKAALIMCEGMVSSQVYSEMLAEPLTNLKLEKSGAQALAEWIRSRSILAEVQALVSKTVFPSPKRMSTGIDYNRLSILIAVVEKRLGIYFSTQDVYVNVTGGLRLDEPSSDLGIVMALISAYRDIEIPDNLVAIGEVGLSGEIRSVSFIESRVKEAARLGFRRIVVPYRLAKKLEKLDLQGAEIVPVKSVYDLGKMFPRSKGAQDTPSSEEE